MFDLCVATERIVDFGNKRGFNDDVIKNGNLSSLLTLWGGGGGGGGGGEITMFWWTFDVAVMFI